MVAACKEERFDSELASLAARGRANLLVSEFFYRDLKLEVHIAMLKQIFDAAFDDYKIVLYVGD